MRNFIHYCQEYDIRPASELFGSIPSEKRYSFYTGELSRGLLMLIYLVLLNEQEHHLVG